MRRSWYIIILMLFFLGLAATLLYLQPNYTGYQVFEQDLGQEVVELQTVWGFSVPEDYDYNDSEIVISNGEVSLNPTITTTNWTEKTQEVYTLVSATYNPKDKTDKMKFEDNMHFETKKDKLLNIFFDNKLDNGDLISMHLKSGTASEIYLCPFNTFCSSPGYGSVDYGGGDGWYTITLSDLEQPLSYFNLDPLKVKIDFVNSTAGNLTKALYNPKDKLSKVMNQDGTNHKVEDDNIFDIGFNHVIREGDIISFYIKSGDASELYLCDVDISCLSPGYGSMDYDGGEGWYNISVGDVGPGLSLFNILTEKTKFDYISAIHKNTTQHSITNISYPTQAFIQTPDISFYELKKITGLSALNDQNITYQYSTDSGVTWADLPDDLSKINATTIRFGLILMGNGTATPKLSSLTVDYTALYTPKKTYFQINDTGRLNISTNKISRVNRSDIILDISTKVNISNARITIKNRALSNLSYGSLNPLKEFIEIILDDALNDNLNLTTFRVYYTPEDIASKNLDESTLKIYYYNGTSEEWEALSSTVDMVHKFIEVTLHHFSIYGVFGDEIQGSGSSGGSSGGGRRDRKEIIENQVIGKESFVSDSSFNSSKNTSKIELLDSTQPFIPDKDKNQKDEALTGFQVFQKNVQKFGDIGLLLAILTVMILLIVIVHRVFWSGRQK